MLHPNEALRIIEASARLTETERIPLENARGKALSAPVACLVDQPPFDKAKMDGFAYRVPSSGSAEGTYRVIGRTAAGEASAPALAEGECVRIMTGAPISSGADAVHRFEFSEQANGAVRFVVPEEEDNIIRRGSQIRAGEELMGPRLLSGADLAVLAACGHSSVEVRLAPKVAVVSTGAELRNPGEALGPGAIYDSNGILLRSLVRSAFCEAHEVVRVGDDLEGLARAMSKALEDADLLILSGGVSMGDFDFVPAASEAIGAETLFHKVALKPGKPAYFARLGDRFILGCPGNPLSAFVVFELFAKPLLYALRGLEYVPRTIDPPLSRGIGRTTKDRVEYVPVAIENGVCRPVRCDGSSMITALAETDGLVRIDIGVEGFSEGDRADVRLVR